MGARDQTRRYRIQIHVTPDGVRLYTHSHNRKSCAYLGKVIQHAARNALASITPTNSQGTNGLSSILVDRANCFLVIELDLLNFPNPTRGS